MRIRNIYAIATALVLAATIGVQSASAQSETLTSKIPFEFYAGGKLFPAGTYTVTQVNASTLRLQDSRGGGVYIAAGRESVRMDDGNLVVFNQYGKRRFLAGAYWSGSSISLRIPESRGEKEAARVGRARTQRLDPELGN
jgi:hypothetical protein